MLFARLIDLLVDGEQRLRRTPVHLGHELTAEGVDDARNTGGLPLADEVEIEHALACLRLEAIDERSGLGVEEGVLGGR